MPYGTGLYGSGLYGDAAVHPYAGVSGKVMWILQVDWDRDGVFGGDIEPQNYQKVTLRRGRKNRVRSDGTGLESPQQESLWIEILDTAQRYDPFNTSGPLYDYLLASGCMLRVMIISTTTRAPAEWVFVGTLDKVNYDAKKKKATIIGQGVSRMLKLDDAEALYTNCQPYSPAGAWDPEFDYSGLTPFPVNYWQGRADGLRLQECVRLTLDKAGYPLGYFDADKNDEEVEYFYHDGSSGWASLEELADGFAARLFILRDGRIYMMDRQDVSGTSGSVETPPDRVQEEYGLERYGTFESLRNRARVNIYPHSVPVFAYPWPATAYKLAWSNAGPIKVPAGGSVILDVQYTGDIKQGSFARVNSDVSDTLQWGAFLNADKTGSDERAMGRATFEVLSGTNGDGDTVTYGNVQQWTRIKLTNGLQPADVYFFDLQVLVAGIQQTDSAGVLEAEDTASQVINGKRTLTISSRWVQDSDRAQRIASAYVDAFSAREKGTPIVLVYQWSGQTLYENLLLFDIGTMVDFGAAGGATSIANYGMVGKWLVVSQETTWMSADGQDCMVTLTFEKPTEYSAPVLNAARVNSQAGNFVSSITWNHVCSNNANRLLIVPVSLRAYEEVISITYGTQSLTKYGAIKEGGTNNPRVELWYLLAPTANTSLAVTVTLSGPEYVQAAAMDFYNAHQTVPLGPLATAAGGLGSVASSVSALANVGAGDIVVDALVTYGAAFGSPGAGQTWDNVRYAPTSDGNWRMAGSTKTADDASTAMTWTFAASQWAALAVAIKGIVA